MRIFRTNPPRKPSLIRRPRPHRHPSHSGLFSTAALRRPVPSSSCAPVGAGLVVCLWGRVGLPLGVVGAARCSLGPVLRPVGASLAVTRLPGAGGVELWVRLGDFVAGTRCVPVSTGRAHAPVTWVSGAPCGDVPRVLWAASRGACRVRWESGRRGHAGCAGDAVALVEGERAANHVDASPGRRTNGPGRPWCGGARGGNQQCAGGLGGAKPQGAPGEGAPKTGRSGGCRGKATPARTVREVDEQSTFRESRQSRRDERTRKTGRVPLRASPGTKPARRAGGVGGAST